MIVLLDMHSNAWAIIHMVLHTIHTIIVLVILINLHVNIHVVRNDMTHVLNTHVTRVIN